METTNENKDIKTYTISDLVKLIQSYRNGAISDKELNEFGETMTIRQYIPIIEKATITTALIVAKQYADVSAIETKITRLYLYKFFYIVLGGYAMVDITDRDMINYENYDLLYPFFNPFVMHYCSEDYKVIDKMIDDCVNMYNVQEMAEAFNSLDENVLLDTMKESTKLLGEFESNKKYIEDLKHIAYFNDPEKNRILGDIRERARKSVMTLSKDDDKDDGQNS